MNVDVVGGGFGVFFSLNLSVILHPLVFPRKRSVLLFLWARNIDLLSIIQHSNRQSWSTPFFSCPVFMLSLALSRSLSVSMTTVLTYL